jgi:hypothetical protein
MISVSENQGHIGPDLQILVVYFLNLCLFNFYRLLLESTIRFIFVIDYELYLSQDHEPINFRSV